MTVPLSFDAFPSLLLVPPLLFCGIHTTCTCENVVNYNRARANYQSSSYRDNDYQKYDGRGILHGSPELITRDTCYITVHCDIS